MALGLRCFDCIDGKGDLCRQHLNGDKSRYLCGRLSGNKKTNQSGIFDLGAVDSNNVPRKVPAFLLVI